MKLHGSASIEFESERISLLFVPQGQPQAITVSCASPCSFLQHSGVSASSSWWMWFSCERFLAQQQVPAALLAGEQPQSEQLPEHSRALFPTGDMAQATIGRQSIAR